MASEKGETMPDASFTSLAVVMGVAFLAPLVLGLLPRLRIPAVVLEIVLGIVIGPQVLGWASVDEPVQIVALIGLAFLLFLAGLELDFDQLRGRLLKVAAVGFGISLVLAVVAGFALDAVGFVHSPLLAAVVLTATSLGLVIPVLKEGGHSATRFGQLVIAGASIGDFAAVLLLSLLFSRDSTDTGTKVVLLVGFVLAVALIVFALSRHRRSMPISRVLTKLQDTTAQIRVRGSMLLLLILVVLAGQFGLETILGAFIAGAIVSVLDRDGVRTHPQFRLKLEAIGYGFLIPVFFVTSGLRFDLNALLDAPSTLQATSLPFIVAAMDIGLSIHAVTQATAAAFIAAGLLSALVFPVVALGVLRTAEPSAALMAPTTVT